MSILIKGIDLPKEGEHIIALIKTEGKVSYFEQDIETTTCKIMKEAQAIQIDRPHGRLIDGDKFIESNECCGWIEDMTVETFNKLTPTILEAEE